VIKTLSRALAIGLLVLTVVVTVLMAAAWTTLPLDRVALDLHGESFSLADLADTHAFLFFVGAVATVVIALVVAFVFTIFGLCLGALGIAIGLLATIGSLALVVAPFVLIGWLIWRLLRREPARAIATGP
jgi:hypothetical protein